MFASNKQIMGHRAGKRDDIESFFYVMAYLLNDEYLPWSDLSKMRSDSFHPDKITFK